MGVSASGRMGVDRVIRWILLIGPISPISPIRRHRIAFACAPKLLRPHADTPIRRYAP
jgi:hypothetical protein